MYTIENYRKFLQLSEKINEQTQLAIKLQNDPHNQPSTVLPAVLGEIQKMAASLGIQLSKAIAVEIAFDKLPQIVEQLNDRLGNIEQLLLSKNNDSQPESDSLLTIKQAAEILHLSVPTIYSYVHRSEIPVCKRGKRLYFSKQELTAWIMAGRKKTLLEIEAEVDTYLAARKKRKS